VTLLRSYPAFLTVPESLIPRGDHVELFDRVGFVAEAQEDCHVRHTSLSVLFFLLIAVQAFLEALCGTQLFEVFLQQRISHKRDSDDPFERLLRAKNERRIMRLGAWLNRPF
jgi:hypothetical protein